MHAHASTTESFAEQVRNAGSAEEFQVLMKNYIASHFVDLLGSKVLLLNTRDGLDRLSDLVRQKLAERAGRLESVDAQRRAA